MPTGDAIKGRLFNVVGEAIDGLGQHRHYQWNAPIHRQPPRFEDLATDTEVLFTGIKVIDLIEPYAKGGKIGLFGGAGVGKNRIDPGADQQHRKRSRGFVGICRCR